MKTPIAMASTTNTPSSSTTSSFPAWSSPLDDRIMVGITNTLDLWTYRDSDGDGVADEKVKIHEGGKTRRQHGAPTLGPHLEPR